MDPKKNFQLTFQEPLTNLINHLNPKPIKAIYQ